VDDVIVFRRLTKENLKRIMTSSCQVSKRYSRKV